MPTNQVMPTGVKSLGQVNYPDSHPRDLPTLHSLPQLSPGLAQPPKNGPGWGQEERISGKKLPREPPGARLIFKVQFLSEPRGGSVSPGSRAGDLAAAGGATGWPSFRQAPGVHYQRITYSTADFISSQGRDLKETPAEE